MKGVIQRVYDAWRTRNGLAHQSVRNISDSELQAIYRENYWAEVKGDQLPAGLDLAVFDFGVNSGPYRSILKLQGVLGVNADGQMGPVTLAAVARCDAEKTVIALQAARRAFVRQIKVYWRFGKGWESRITGVQVAALAMVGKDPVQLPPPPVPKPSPEAQSASQGRATEEKAATSPKVVAATAGAAASAASAAVTAPSIPAPPTETVSAISAWQSFGTVIRDAANFCTEHWPFALGAVGLYVGLVYALPALYRRFAT
jgi:lysozyme family protein